MIPERSEDVTLSKRSESKGGCAVRIEIKTGFGYGKGISIDPSE